MQRRGEMGTRSGDMDTPEPLSPSLSPNEATRCAVSVIGNIALIKAVFVSKAVITDLMFAKWAFNIVLVDTTPGGSVNEETASLARELSAVCLSVSVCVGV